MTITTRSGEKFHFNETPEDLRSRVEQRLQLQPALEAPAPWRFSEADGSVVLLPPTEVVKVRFSKTSVHADKQVYIYEE